MWRLRRGDLQRLAEELDVEPDVVERLLDELAFDVMKKSAPPPEDEDEEDD